MTNSLEKDFRSDPDFLHNVALANLMLLNGQPQNNVDVLFLHDRAYGDSTNLFEIAGRMHKTGAVRFIATPNTDGARFGGNIPGEASPGKVWTIERLLEQQVPLEYILQPDTPALHTREENDAFLELSIQQGWISGIILTQPHQLLRALLGMIQSMKQNGYCMRISTAAPVFTPWYEVVYGSQGMESKPRKDHIDDELRRIYEYQKKGDLASFEECFAYLKDTEEETLVLGHTGRGSARFRETLPPNFQGGLAL